MWEVLVSLPVKTTADDVRKIVNYFKTKATGATLAEATASLGAAAVDGRKITAFRVWGFLDKDGAKYKLSERGWTLARTPDLEPTVFREVLDASKPYRSALEWMHHQEFENVSVVDTGAHWHQFHLESVGPDVKDSTLRENAVAFFRLAEAAGLGRMTAGRGGNPTRFDIDRDALRQYVEAGPSTTPWTENEGSTEDLELETLADPEPESVPPSVPTPHADAAGGQEKIRVFIAHGPNMSVVDQIQVMLGLADIESEVAEQEESTAIPVPEKVFSAMRRCHAGIIAVTVDERRVDADGKYTLNENVLIEIGAAFVLYDKRVVLLWDKRLPVPSNVQGLYRCEFEGDELSWTAGMKLMKAIQDFKK
jgi:hypothetical protein